MGYDLWKLSLWAGILALLLICSGLGISKDLGFLGYAVFVVCVSLFAFCGWLVIWTPTDKKYITVKKLIKALKEYPDNTKVTYSGDIVEVIRCPK